MCYYYVTNYSCGDCVWGTRVLLCTRAERLERSQNCGARLISEDNVHNVDRKCHVCQAAEGGRQVRPRQNQARQRAT
jgi:hypothetical protein